MIVATLFVIESLSIGFISDSYAMGPKVSLPLHRVILGGKVTTEKSKSWRSVVKLNISENYTCTGTFIGYKRILTAAHCLTNGKYLTSVTFFKGGSYYTSILLKKSDQRVKLNHHFYAGAYGEDLAMVYLNENVMPSGYYPMAIATTDHFSDFNELIGKRVYMIGASDNQMGTLAFAKGTIENTYSSISVKGHAGREGICGGDSGGPLVMDVGGELILLGVLAGYHMSYNRVPNDQCTEGGHYAPFTSWAADYFEETSL